MADGPVIQKAGEKPWLGIGLAQVLAMVRVPRSRNQHARRADGLRQPGGALRPDRTARTRSCATPRPLASTAC